MRWNIRSSTAFIHPFILYCFSAFHRKTTSRDRLSRLSVKQKNVRSRDINTCLFAKFKGNTAEDHACQQVLSDPELHGRFHTSRHCTVDRGCDRRVA